MTLEDFFTLAEMKGGLSTLGRVDELVSVMQQQKDCVISNIGDAARQWSTVACTLAVTDNKDCLDHFIDLNGLYFFNQWLQDVQKCDNDTSGNVAEDSIEALLTSLERLPIDVEKPYFSEIKITIQQLLCNKSISIKERAKILFDKWSHVKVNDANHHNIENPMSCPNYQLEPSVDPNVNEKALHSANPVHDVSTHTGENDEGSYNEKSAWTESHLSNVTFCSESSQIEKDEKVSSESQITPAASLNLPDANPHLSNSCPENLSIAEESSVCPSVGMASTSTCSSPSGGKRRGADDQNDVSVFKDVDGAKEKELDTEGGSPFKSNQNDVCNDALYAVISASIPSSKGTMEPTAPCISDAQQRESCISESIEPRQNSGSSDSRMEKHVMTNEFNLFSSVTKGYQDLSTNGGLLRKVDGTETSSNRKEIVGSSSIIGELGIEADETRGEDVMIARDPSIDVEIKGTEKLNKKSGSELDEEFDPLAVARQVAIEVEREVVDYREPFNSSPEANSGETMRACSPVFVQYKQDGPATEELKENMSPTGKDLSDCALSAKQDSLRTSENVVTDPEGSELDVETQNVHLPAREMPRNLEKNVCHFDLNEDVCTEEFHCSSSPALNISVNLSAPVAVVASSKGYPGLPVGPLHFEGGMGWNGSAATSAFRPASPRRTPDGEKTYAASKAKVNFLGIDLNFAESDGDVVVNPTKLAPVSSGLPSGDSYVEVSSKRAERLKLDLNCIGEEDASPCPSYWRFNRQNGGDHCLSTASSASSRQPSMRDFDLNDNPSTLDAGPFHNSIIDAGPLKSSVLTESPKVDDPVVVIMGSRMAMERKEYSSQAQQSLMGNGLSIETPMASRLMLPYAHMLPPAYAYNGFAPGPAMSISPALYGPGSIHYIVDSRRATVVPQVLSPPVLNSASSSRPPFVMSVSSTPSNLNGIGSSRPGLDLNSVMTMENGSRFILEEQSVNPSQPASSGVALKRKEPDSGWEPYPFGYKQVTSWQ